MLAGLRDGTPAYFVHSYVAQPRDAGIVVAETEHGGRFASIIVSGRLVGYQFHPERSGRDGLTMLANLVRLVADERPAASPSAAARRARPGRRPPATRGAA